MFWDDVDKQGITTTILIGTMAHYLLSEPHSDDELRAQRVLVSFTPTNFHGFTEMCNRGGARLANVGTSYRKYFRTVRCPHDLHTFRIDAGS